MKQNIKFIFMRLLRSYYNIYLVLFIIFAIGLASHPIFGASQNLINILRQISILLIISVGQNLVILIGGIDLSVGSVISFISVFVVAAIPTIGPFLSILAGLTLGFIIGAINGLIIAKFKIMPFLMTFCSWVIYQGLALSLHEGGWMNVYEPSYLKISSFYIFGILPAPIFYSLIVFSAGILVLSRTTFGVGVYAVGGNEEAARLSGINPVYTKIFVYAISGFFAGVAAIILSSLLRIGHPIMGLGYELDSIAAVCIGGTLLTGGEGSLIGTLGGVLIMGILKNIFNLQGISPYVQQVATGTIILFAVLFAKKKSK
ncbi:MAG: ABC transporter permease [Candidatus Marinimicrobia bacterium]|nr:ABC transporter permease [Candidatus Neomarinimicrobiota bacterium]